MQFRIEDIVLIVEKVEWGAHEPYTWVEEMDEYVNNGKEYRVVSTDDDYACGLASCNDELDRILYFFPPESLRLI